MMPSKTSRPLIVCAIAFIAGSTGVTLTMPAMAQQSSTQMPVHMAQASSLNNSWRLANMTAADSPMPMLPIGEVTADFANGKISGSGGCNRFMGSYKTTGNQLKIGPLGSTFKACEEGLMTQEANFLKALQAAQRYEVNKDGLQIFYKTDQGSGVLRFVPQTVQGLW